MQHRYVHGAGVDEPVVWYEGSAVSSATRRYLHANHQGSIVATTNAAGAKLGIGTYDGYGVTSAPSTWRFQYTGQAAIPQIGLYYYKARFYNPALGRFMQTDPIGYEDDNNLYAYVGSDPLNRTDPTGKWCVPCVWVGLTALEKAVVVTAGLLGIGAAAETIINNQQDGNAPPAESPKVRPTDIAGKTPGEIDAIAKEKGLVPKGPNPQDGKGSYVDPVTGKQRVLVHPDATDPSKSHSHVNNPAGERQDIEGNTVPAGSKEAHLPLGSPAPTKRTSCDASTGTRIPKC